MNLLRKNVSFGKLRIYYRIEFIGFTSVFILSILVLIFNLIIIVEIVIEHPLKLVPKKVSQDLWTWSHKECDAGIFLLNNGKLNMIQVYRLNSCSLPSILLNTRQNFCKQLRPDYWFLNRLWVRLKFIEKAFIRVKRGEKQSEKSKNKCESWSHTFYT